MALLGPTSITQSNYSVIDETTSVDYLQLVWAAFTEILPILAPLSKSAKNNAIKGKENLFSLYNIFRIN